MVNQRVIVLGAAALGIAMGLLPSWKQVQVAYALNENYADHWEESGGYGFILSLLSTFTSIDMGRLAAEYGTVAIAAGGAYTVFGRPSEHPTQ